MIHHCQQIDDLLKIKDVPNNPELAKYRYQAFVLISIGIESLGAAFDKDSDLLDGKASKRFKLALSNMKSLEKYRNSELNLPQSWLKKQIKENGKTKTIDICFIYDNLRCGLAHVGLPKKNIALSTLFETTNKSEKSEEEEKEEDKRGFHLQCIQVSQRKVLLLLIEPFFDDFKEACEELASLIDINDSRLRPNIHKPLIIQSSANIVPCGYDLL